jgi:lipopolysaccharide export system protein LptA
MALTAEEQAQVELQRALSAATEEVNAPQEARRIKADMVRVAQSIAMENHRIDTSGNPITAASVTAIATELMTFINA